MAKGKLTKERGSSRGPLSRRAKMILAAIGIVVVAAVVPWSRIFADVDEHYIPYGLSGMTVWFFPNVSHPGVELTQFAATYDERESALSRCSALAHREANRLESLEPDDPERDGFIVGGWSYVCCTRTGETNCKTKVR